MAEQAQTADKPIQAAAVWWNIISVYVHCPSCEKIHKHGFAGYDGSQRLSHCSRPVGHVDYEILYPFNEQEGDVSYEIDKQRALFVAGGADPAEYFVDQTCDQQLSLTQDMGSRRKWIEATETISFDSDQTPGGYTCKLIDCVVSNMIFGHIEPVSQYLESSTESDIFLHGVSAWDYPGNNHDGDGDDSSSKRLVEKATRTSGKTALHLAACEICPRILELLLQKGASPNARDVDGRTPLVEAALWGRLENVKTLLKFGAEKELECVRNGRRLQAVDFARPLPANVEERHERCGMYREDTYQRDLDRKAIVCLLKNRELEESLHQNHHNIAGFAFTRSPTTLIAHFDIPNEWKTIGVLYRGSAFHPVAAMSGWGHQEDPDINIQIGGRDWIDEIRRLCEIVGHSLEPNARDQGQAGRYNACHAEKQLVAYFVNKHLFLAHETGDDLDMARLHLGEPSAEESNQLKHREKLSALKSAAPATSLKKAKIMVCRPICSDCHRFVERTNTALGLDITVSHH
ncbi:unnamed protein product [Clonostachys solani]|uniref:Single-strand DNA deaminase toxin A-like C-terminal domain-containing protein n=1 Tax=Clonostachys solani TaxID=160281 RepID=A0A9N9ZBB4_9HYPO|nr:unnamed protein product [Clonostachys solani]